MKWIKTARKGSLRILRYKFALAEIAPHGKAVRYGTPYNPGNRGHDRVACSGGVSYRTVTNLEAE